MSLGNSPLLCRFHYKRNYIICAAFTLMTVTLSSDALFYLQRNITREEARCTGELEPWIFNAEYSLFTLHAGAVKNHLNGDALWVVSFTLPLWNGQRTQKCADMKADSLHNRSFCRTPFCAQPIWIGFHSASRNASLQISAFWWRSCCQKQTIIICGFTFMSVISRQKEIPHRYIYKCKVPTQTFVDLAIFSYYWKMFQFIFLSLAPKAKFKNLTTISQRTRNKILVTSPEVGKVVLFFICWSPQNLCVTFWRGTLNFFSFYFITRTGVWNICAKSLDNANWSARLAILDSRY